MRKLKQRNGKKNGQICVNTKRAVSFLTFFSFITLAGFLVFNEILAWMIKVLYLFKVQEEEVMTENMCIKRGCSNLAVKSPEWDDEFCSDECAVGHCKDVFSLWVAEQP